MKLSLVQQVLFLGVILGLTAACREDLEEPENEHLQRSESKADSPTTDHQLVPVAGPDEAFFASHFLETALIHASDSDALIGAIVLVEERIDQIKHESEDFPSFDFRRNFSHDRLVIMKDYILYLNDQSASGALTGSNLQGVRLDPRVLGNPGSERLFAIDESVFEVLADRDGKIGDRQLEILLIALGHLIESQNSFSLNSQDYRKQLLDKWDLVIAQFDENQDGVLDLDEYRRLREQRRLMLEGLRSKISLRNG